MLRELSIENLAVIEKASVEFGNKFNVFTGETGAGKSILIGGINAILGGRVSKDIVRAGCDKSVIIGVFDNVSPSTENILKEYGFDISDILILQREIYADGKSVARINGRVATISALKEISSELIDIHGQHDNRILTDSEKQRELLDNYAGISDLLNEYREYFKSFSVISKKINSLIKSSDLQKEKIAILKEKISEIDYYKFSIDEEEEIAKQLSVFKNIEQITENLTDCINDISGDDETLGAYSLIRDCRNKLSVLAGSSDEFDKLSNRLDQVIIELEDIKQDIFMKIPDDNEDVYSKISSLEERMSAIIKLKHKYGLELNEIISQCEKWKNEIKEFDFSDEAIEELHNQKKNAGENVKRLAATITNKRKETADLLAKRISEELEYLDMPDIRLVFDITQDKVTLNGMDNVEMLISVNKGEELKSMSKIASGGELSRIMLAIKNVLARSDNISTMIFDEIDTGISGRAAQKVGIKLSEISKDRQIICVTHLAQIAATADRHFKIQKNSDNNRTYTSINLLDYSGRKKEIARIISGDEQSNVSLETAEELLNKYNN